MSITLSFLSYPIFISTLIRKLVSRRKNSLYRKVERKYSFLHFDNVNTLYENNFFSFQRRKIFQVSSHDRRIDLFWKLAYLKSNILNLILTRYIFFSSFQIMRTFVFYREIEKQFETFSFFLSIFFSHPWSFHEILIRKTWKYFVGLISVAWENGAIIRLQMQLQTWWWLPVLFQRVRTCVSRSRDFQDARLSHR